MIQKLVYFVTLSLLSTLSMSQSSVGFVDDFSDGNFSSNPVWIGDTSKFWVNANLELQLNDTFAVKTSPSYLSTVSTSINNAVWEFNFKYDFSPSTSNYGIVYLVADQSDVSQALDGYYVWLGGVSGSTDDVSLYKTSRAVSTDVKIIDGRNGTVGTSSVDLRVRVTRDSLGNWELFSDTSAHGNNYISEGTIRDTTHLTSSYFGLYCRYSSGRSDNFYFDSILVSGSAFSDQLPPQLTNLSVIDSVQLVLQFSERIKPSSVLSSNFIVNNGIGSAISSSIVQGDSTRISLNFSFSFSKWKLLSIEHR